jgi:3-deoxy-D-arabino-heptulosonate 7-phosphate (DAHP) synthase
LTEIFATAYKTRGYTTKPYLFQGNGKEKIKYFGENRYLR